MKNQCFTISIFLLCLTLNFAGCELPEPPLPEEISQRTTQSINLPDGMYLDTLSLLLDPSTESGLRYVTGLDTSLVGFFKGEVRSLEIKGDSLSMGMFDLWPDNIRDGDDLSASLYGRPMDYAFRLEEVFGQTELQYRASLGQWITRFAVETWEDPYLSGSVLDLKDWKPEFAAHGSYNFYRQ